MEFFEKAHVIRGSDSKTSKNSDDVVKRQLRQMLYGYKQSDNEIIKHSIDLDNDEDSSSVSGFSDLNLTSSEIDTSKESRGSIDDIIKKGVFNDSVDLHNNNNVDLTLGDPHREEGSPRSASDDSSKIFLDVGGYCLRNRKVINSIDLDMKSIDYNSDKSVSDNMISDEDSILFDADGQLASKIRSEIKRKRTVQSDGNKKNVEKQVKYHHITISEDSSEESKLGKKERTKIKSRNKRETTLANEKDNIINNEEIVKPKKQKFKNKLEINIDREILNSDTSSYSDENVNIRQRVKPKIESKKKSKGRIHSVLLQNFRDFRDGDFKSEDNNQSNETVIKELDETDYADEEVDKMDNSSIALTESTSVSSVIDIIDASSPFVSMAVSEMSVPSFNEILGNYKHATMQNVPSQNQRVTFLTKDFENYSIADQNNEIVIEEADIPTEDNSVCDLSCDTVDEIVNNDVSNVTTDDITNIIHEEESQSEETLSETLPIDNDADFNDQVQIYYSRDNCVMVLRHPGQIFIHGKVQIKALGGTAEVFGYTLNDKPSEIYAPYTDYAMCIKSVQNDNVYYGLFAKLTGLGLSVIEAETIVTTLGEYDVVLSLKSLKKQRIDFVEKCFTNANLFKKRKFDLNCLQSASNYLECSVYTNTPPKIFKDKRWDEIVSQECDKKSIGLVCGGKGVGKSTFLRYYVNRQLRHGPILVIDLDPGQCEFTAAGNISASVITEPLLGPNFTHLKTPEKMLNIGIINTMDNPRRYINAVIELISYCRSHLRFCKMPWIVNTMGMTNAMGLEFITLTILYLQPTFLLQINSVNEKKGFGLQLNSNTVHELYMKRYQWKPLFKNVCQDELHYNFYNVDKAHTIKNKTSIAPRHERYLNFLAYFGEALEMGPEKGLLEITPYQVHLSTLNVACNVDIRRESIMKVLNGKIVALCQQNTNERGKVFALSDKPLLCHGHGLVRGIDYDTGVLYITCPMLMERLILVNTLLYADWVPELLGQESHLPHSTTLPYRTATDYQQRQLMLSTERRFNPVLQLKMTRRSENENL